MKFIRQSLSLLLTVGLAGPAFSREADDGGGTFVTFNSLKATHPRLLIQEDTAAESRRRLCSKEDTRQAYEALVKIGRAMLSEPPVQYLPGDMLEISRTVLKRVQTLAFLYRADGDRRWLDRAKVELLAAAAFPDWHTQHFLDTAEMMASLALGYDWLYDKLSAAERDTICGALVSKGLNVAKDAYDRKDEFWVRDNTTNWNIVCNSSILMAALAVGNDDVAQMKLASEMATCALAHLRQGMSNYAPAGGWDEGPMYWRYATIYATRAMASLQTACGSDFGLSDSPGLSQTGDYIMSMVGPTGLTFNYADSTTDFADWPESEFAASYLTASMSKKR